MRTVRAELLLPADAHSHFTVLWLSAAQPRARQSIRWWDERMVGIAGIWGRGVNMYALWAGRDTIKSASVSRVKEGGREREGNCSEERRTWRECSSLWI